MSTEITSEVKINTIRLTADASLAAEAITQDIVLPKYAKALNFDNYGETTVTIRMRGDSAPAPGISVNASDTITLTAPNNSVYNVGEIAISFTAEADKSNGLEIVIESYIGL